MLWAVLVQLVTYMPMERPGDYIAPQEVKTTHISPGVYTEEPVKKLEPMKAPLLILEPIKTTHPAAIPASSPISIGSLTLSCNL